MHRTHDTACEAADILPDAPESVKAVLCALEDHEPKTQKDIQEETGLPRRTLYTALRRLKDEGIVQQRISLRDTRQSYFWFPAGSAAS